MHPEHTPAYSPQMHEALIELEGMIRERYPTAIFAVGPGEDDPDAVHLTAIVDVDDPDEVMDLVVDRVMELQAEAALPLHVIPIRTPERVEALRRAAEAATPAWRRHWPPARHERPLT
jgi:hypothetical protein